MVTFIEPNSPAANAGIAVGAILNGFSSTTDLQNFTHSHIGQEVAFSVTESNKTRNINVTLSQKQDAPLGVGITSITRIKQPVWQAFITSIVETGKTIGQVFVLLVKIIGSVFTTGHGGEAAEGVVGPVGLFNFTGAALKLGWVYVLQLLAILSINLGIINILPFPALDGGKILFLGLEGIFRRKVVRQEVENIIHFVGFALLIILIIAITWRDIVRLR
jgi:regulator of sigma E protease